MGLHQLLRQDEIILAELTAIAAAGERCPANTELAKKISARGSFTVSRIFEKLEKRGLIEVERRNAARRIRIVATGDQTAPVTGKLYHDRDMSQFAAKQAQARAALKRPLPPLPEITEAPDSPRDPCFRCGVRGDVGCKHRKIISGPHSAAGSPAAVALPAAAGVSVSPVHGAMYAQ
ncbi:hypothetical protein [uncultured Novosphingobium sp.]|uniref:hypothetical protein n=1 Tax=uncultured Novosphingobium sp. TaxID=292277 RepID=UPI0037486A51